MLMPSARHCRIAGTPSAVPGILTMTFARPHAFQRRLASAMVPCVSRARCGPTSIETKPSSVLQASYTGRKTSAALRTSATASASNTSAGDFPPAPSLRMSSS